MKKIMILVAVTGTMFSATAQTTTTVDAQQATGTEQAVKAPKSAGIEQYQLAVQLAKWGYSANSPTSLIEAARIMSDFRGEALEAEYVQGEGENVQGENEHTFTVEQLLADAKKMADGDAELIAQADEVDQTISRGAVGGSKYSRSCVYAYSTDTYRIKFRKGQLAEVALSGDGDTDLDLYVYDANGNSIDCDTDYSDDCYARWCPRWTGTFTIKVVNRGPVSNYYTLVTN